MTAIRAPYLPQDAIRARARRGNAAAFPDLDGYGRTLFGAGPREPLDELDALRIVPPVFVPGRLEKMFELGREPMWNDVDLSGTVGGFATPLPVFVCAFGSTEVAGGDLGVAAGTQAGRLGIPMVIGENVVPMRGYGRMSDDQPGRGLVDRIRAYAEVAPAGQGGVVVQQSTEDADAEVWNLVYSDPYATGLLDDGRLAFELKVGQGAKPGLGGMTVLTRTAADAVRRRYTIDDALGASAVGLGRAALVAVDEDPTDGLVRLVRCLELELRLLTSALGKYRVCELDREDLWLPEPPLGFERRAHDDHRTDEPCEDLQRDRAG